VPVPFLDQALDAPGTPRGGHAYPL
jgi:hypothetical protein